MDVSPLIPPKLGQRAATVPVADPRLQPTPDYGTLGPSSDIATGTTDASANETSARSQFARRSGPSVVIAAGVLMALLVGNVGSAPAAWNHIASLFEIDLRIVVSQVSLIHPGFQLVISTVSSRRHRLRLFSSAPSAAIIMLPIKSRRASINGAEG